MFYPFKSSGLVSFGMFTVFITLGGAAIYCSLIGPAGALFVFFLAKSVVNDLPGPRTISGFFVV